MYAYDGIWTPVEDHCYTLREDSIHRIEIIIIYFILSYELKYYFEVMTECNYLD